MLGERGGEESESLGALLLVLPRALRVRLGAEWGKMHTSCGARGEEQGERLKRVELPTDQSHMHVLVKVTCMYWSKSHACTDQSRMHVHVQMHVEVIGNAVRERERNELIRTVTV